MARFRFRSLHFKIAAGVITTILVISSFQIVADYRSSRRRLLDELQKSADRLAAISLQSVVELAIVGQHPKLLQPALERLGANSSVDRIWLLDLSGEVRFSSDTADLGRRFEQFEEGCRNCHSLPPSRRPSSVFFELASHQILRNVRPIPNPEECHRCHEPKQRHNGVLVIDFDTEGIWSRLRADFQESLVRVGLTVLAILIVLGVLMNKLVILPLGKLSRATAELAQSPGSSEMATITGSDEIGHLGQSFDKMAGQVRAAIQELTGQRTYLQNLMNSLPDGLVVVDRSLRVEITNHAAERIWDPQQLEDILAGQTAFPEIGRTVRKCFETGELATCQLKLEPQPQGTSRRPPSFVEIHCSPVRGAGPEIEKAVLLIRDVSRRKAFEAQASRAERLATVGRLAAGVAHEINNPMAAITTCVEGLSRHVADSKGIGAPDKVEINDYLSTVGEAALRCKEITQRLLSASSEGGPVEFENVDLGEVVREAVRLIEHQALRQGVRIESPETPGPIIRGNRQSLAQLLLNLLLNSLEAVGEQGRIDISLSRRDGLVQLDIADNGRGIPEEDLEHIFDPFFSTKTRGRGTGLGLSISQWIVRQHQGRMQVESRPGQGARFSILLPGPAGEGSST